MTHLPPLVYPEDIKANREWFGDEDPPKYYSECELREGTKECPAEKHYHPTININLRKMIDNTAK